MSNPQFSGASRGKTNYCFDCLDFVEASVLETRFRQDGIRRRTYLCEAGHKFATHEITLPPQPRSQKMRATNNLKNNRSRNE